MAGNVIERYFMVCETNSENSVQYGPYKTVEEAESDAVRLGFDWVLAVTKTVDEYGHVIDTKTRFYQPEGLRQMRKPGDIEQLRRKLVVDVKPMSAEEAAFFAEYEKQITYTCAECGEEIAPTQVFSCVLTHFDKPDETVYFHSDLKRCCPLKWSSKRLAAAGDKLRKILEMFDGESKTSL